MDLLIAGPGALRVLVRELEQRGQTAFERTQTTLTQKQENCRHCNKPLELEWACPWCPPDL